MIQLSTLELSPTDRVCDSTCTRVYLLRVGLESGGEVDRLLLARLYAERTERMSASTDTARGTELPSEFLLGHYAFQETEDCVQTFGIDSVLRVPWSRTMHPGAVAQLVQNLSFIYMCTCAPRSSCHRTLA